MKHKKRGPAHPLLPDPSEYCEIDGKVKRRYATQIDAELNAPSRDLQQYICDTCGSWHNGSSSLPQQIDDRDQRD